MISNNAGNLAASYNAPAMHKQKISYFAKTGEIELTQENVRTVSLITLIGKFLNFYDFFLQLKEFVNWRDVSEAYR